MSSSESSRGGGSLCRLPACPFASVPSDKVGFKKAQTLVKELCVGRLGGDEDFKVRYYALPSSTLTAWGLMAPVRAGLAWPVEGRGSWSLLVMPPDGVLPSPTALRTSLIVLFCAHVKKKVDL